MVKCEMYMKVRSHVSEIVPCHESQRCLQEV